MVCGLLSVIMVNMLTSYWVFIFPQIICLILGIVALGTSSAAKGRGYRGGMATAGLVLGIIGTVWSGLSIIAVVADGASLFYYLLQEKA